ncbi:MAG: hypothetical protein IJP86_03925 [Synergistaceae bacterium]|nr:hypothetical protein [Synergistaceae bacterium]
MSAKTEYVSPDAYVIRFTDADIITASDGAGHTTTSSAENDTRLPAI